MSELYGYDFAWTHVPAQAVKDAGATFVIGYISHDAAKSLTNWRDYEAVGLDTYFVFEDAAARANSGAAAGAQDGVFAAEWLQQNGCHDTTPVFAAIDTASVDLAAAAAYLQAFNAQLKNPVGVYGDYAVVEALVTPDVPPVRYGWQTAAWSSGALSSKAHFYQRNYHKDPAPAGVSASSYDEDVQCRSLPWRSVGGVVTPPPPPPAPAPLPLVHIVRAGETLTLIARNNGVSVAQIVSWNHLANANVIYPNQRLIVGYR